MTGAEQTTLAALSTVCLEDSSPGARADPQGTMDTELSAPPVARMVSEGSRAQQRGLEKE